MNTEQERVLLNKGLLGDYKASIVKLMLTNHGYSDRKQHEVTATSVAPKIEITSDLSEEEIARRYQELMRQGRED